MEEGADLRRVTVTQTLGCPGGGKEGSFNQTQRAGRTGVAALNRT